MEEPVELKHVHITTGVTQMGQIRIDIPSPYVLLDTQQARSLIEILNHLIEAVDLMEKQPKH